MSLTKLYSYIGFLLIAFSSFSNHVVLPISPSTILWLVAVILVVLTLLYSTKDHMHIKKIDLLFIIYSIFIITTQVFISSSLGRIIGLIISFSFYSLVIYSGNRIPIDTLIKYSKYFINFSIFILTVELFQRFLIPVKPQLAEQFQEFTNDSRWIYQYKVSSFMYRDTNGTSIHILIVLFYLLYLKEKIKINYFNAKFTLLSVLNVFTFSRAGIIAMIVGFVYYFFYRNKNRKTKLIFLFFFFTTVLISLPFIITLFLKDLSFQSKLLIIELTYDYITKINLQHFFTGIGLTNSITYFGIYTHNLLLTYFIETGFIGLIFFIYFHYLIIAKTKNTWIIIIPFLVATLVSMNTYMPYLYVTLALICIIDDRAKKTVIKS